METQTFEEQILIEHNSRIKRESWERHCAEVRGEDIWVDFCVWCNCQGDTDNKLRKNERAFAEWLKRENRTLTEYQRRWIAENHFGWQFTWNEEKKEWESKKI
jgi:hypothetical protein